MEHNTALTPRGQPGVQKIDCVDTKAVSLFCNTGLGSCPIWAHSHCTSECFSAGEMMAKCRKRCVLKERKPRNDTTYTKRINPHWNSADLLKGDYHFRNKDLIHANFYTLPPNGAEWLGKDTQPWLRGLIQPALGAASCGDHPLLIPVRFCPAVCHILHSSLLQDPTLRRAAQPSHSSCWATVS